jgi:hypothetical protein
MLDHLQHLPSQQLSVTLTLAVVTGKQNNALVKNVGVDMILPCILTMDKTHIDFGGHLQMEPIMMSDGLLKHGIRAQVNAMRILGYINHSTPAHKPPSRTGIVTADINLVDLIAAGVHRVIDLDNSFLACVCDGIHVLSH